MDAKEPFDPYLKWLGIRSPRRPPNHYRLLGVELFESDPDVISHAADARINHLRNFQTGPHKELAEKILHQIKEAKAILLDEEKKAVYDAQLRTELPSEGEEKSPLPSVAAAVVPPPIAPSARTEAWANPVEPIASPPGSSPPADAGRGFPNRVIWVGTAALVGLLLVLGGLIAVIAGRRSPSPDPGEVAMRSTDESKPADVSQERAAEDSAGSGGEKTSGQPSSARSSPGSEGSPSAGAPPGSSESPKSSSPETKQTSSETKPDSSGQSESPSASPSSPSSAKPESPASPSETATPKSGAAPETTSEKSSEEETSQEKPKESLESEKTIPGPEAPSSEKEKPTPKPESASTSEEKPSPEKSAEKDTRWPAPSAEEQKRAEGVVRDLFKQDLAGAKLPPEKLNLAEKLFQEAVATHDDPPAAYVLFGLSSGLAAAGGDLRKSLEIIEAAGTRFQMNTAGMKLEVLDKALPALRTSPQPSFLAYELADLALAVMEEAVLADQIDLAAQAYKLASGVVKRSNDNELIQEVFSRNHGLQVLQKQYEAFQAAEKQLVASPEDRAANATIGRWHCFFKGLWEKGLPYLSRAQPEQLASLAQADLQSPEDPKKQYLLAEQWLKYAETESEDAKGHIQLRAAHWYRQALPELSGLDKMTAEKQLEKLPTATPLFIRRQRGEVVPGNVALAVAGTKVVGPNSSSEYLIDGRASESYAAYGTSPVTWTITFPKQYSLREIRFLIVNRAGRSKQSGYILGVSSDGKRFTPLVDRSKGQWMGWQVISFPARPVRALQLVGVRESGDREVAVAELEAYCVPPKYPPGTPSTPPPATSLENSSVGPRKKSQPPEGDTAEEEKMPGEKKRRKPTPPQ